MQRPGRRPLIAGYANAALTRDEAVDIAADVGLLVADLDGEGRARPGTARVDIRPSGAGYDLVMPAELARKLAVVLKARARMGL